MSVLIPYLYIVSMSYTLMTLFNKKFENTLILSFVVSVFTLYIGGLFGNIKVSFYASIAFSLLWIIFLAKDLIKKNTNIKTFLKEHITVSFVVFTVIFMFVSIYERYATFSLWDEYSHWGPMVKEMYRLNKFYCVKESYLTFHQEYPPFPALLELLWCYLSNGFEERFLFRGIAIFSSCFIVPILGNVKKGENIIFRSVSIILSLFIFLMSFIIPLNDFARNLTTIYPDALCGLVSAYTLFIIMMNDKPDYFECLNISLLLGTILLIKQINIAFYALIIFYALIKYIWLNKEDKRQNIKTIIFVVIIPLLLSLSWKLYIKPLNLNGQFDINLSTIVEIFKNNEINNPNSYRSTVYTKYINALLNQNILIKPGISYLPLSLIVIVLICLFMYIAKKKKESILMGASLSIGTLGYAFTMLVLYLTSYTEYEATNLASFGRYMSTYIYFEICLLIFVIIYFSIKNLNNKKGIINLLVFSLIIGYSSIDNFDTLKIKNEYSGYEFSYKMQELIKQFDEFISINDKVLIINQIYDSRLNLETEFRYLGYDITIRGFTQGEAIDVNYVSTDLERFNEFYKDYDYVYTYFTDDEITQYFWQGQEEYMLNNRLYYIDDSGLLRLVAWTSSPEY